MNKGRYVFSQLMSLVHPNEFDRFVKKYKGNYRVRSFRCWHQFICLSFGQMTHRDSLRDIVICLQSHKSKLYHLGLSKGVSRSTLSDANNTRDWRIYRDLALHLIQKARRCKGLYLDQGIDLENVVYALDSTTIDLCLNIFWWAKFRRYKGAIKLHTLLDIKCQIPCFIHISEGLQHDVNVLDIIDFEPNAFYVMDKGYTDWTRLFQIHKAGSFFVIRAKNNLAFDRIYSSKIDKASGLRCDQTIRFKNYQAQKDYPQKLRRIKYYDKEHNKTYVYLTNHFEADPIQIVILYINRWKVENFFKWIKQHLKIKTFWGETENAVKTQIWIAVSNFVMIALLKDKFKILHSMNEILQILSVSIFEKNPVNQLFIEKTLQNSEDDSHKQLTIFDL